MLQFKKNETRYTDKEWGADEVAAFEDAISMHGAELRAVREEVGTRPMPEVVRFYGHWKKYEIHLVPLCLPAPLTVVPVARSSARRTRT